MPSVSWMIHSPALPWGRVTFTGGRGQILLFIHRQFSLKRDWSRTWLSVRLNPTRRPFASAPKPVTQS